MWYPTGLRDFGAVWDAMPAANRRKLVQALLEKVEVNETAGTVTAPTPGKGGSRWTRPWPSPKRCTASERATGASSPRSRRSPSRPRPLRAATALCRAHRLRQRIASGEARDQAGLAAALGFSRARVTQLMDLLLLAPDIQESMLHMEVEVGRCDPFAERDLRGIVRALDWREQRAMWAELKARTPRNERDPRSRLWHDDKRYYVSPEDAIRAGVSPEPRGLRWPRPTKSKR